ncbi:MAG: AraC family transcriptional regulator, partial [Eubacteriales bacterium]|nr:AraC family transcriptional regulator [Eubacteriales bacterium]
SHLSSETYDYIDWHWHLEFQLCLTQEGTVLWDVGEEEFIVPEGEGIFINTQRVHMASAFQCEKATFFCVDFLPDFLSPERKGKLYEEHVRPVMNNVSLQGLQIDTTLGKGKEILKNLEEMALQFENVQDGKGREFILAGEVLQIWFLLRQELPTNSESGDGEPDERFRHLLMYMQNHYSEGITLDALATHVGLSRSECCRYFKKRTGRTLMDYLTQYRLHKSMEELRQSDKSISRIAQDCGFQSQSYYTKRFRELTGVTPRQFRKRIAKNS